MLDVPSINTKQIPNINGKIDNRNVYDFMKKFTQVIFKRAIHRRVTTISFEWGFR